MIAVFLPPFRFRGVSAPYLWVFYKLLTEFKNSPLIFIAGADYRSHINELTKEGARWEFDSLAIERLGYKIPIEQDLKHHIFRDLSDKSYQDLLRNSGGNPSRAFEKFLTEINCELCEELEEKLVNQHGNLDIDVILSICNCPSLKTVCARHDIPVIHLELGPLRLPEYRYSAYFDFKGVNGGSEAAERWGRAGDFFGNISLDDLFNFFLIDSKKESNVVSEKKDVDRFGVALQVEDDSNLIAYSNGFDGKDLIAFAKSKNLSGKPILVRPHPSALFSPKELNMEIDRSSSARVFLMRCKEVFTINSSVALEAMLLAREVSVLGDASYAFIQNYSGEERNKRLCFYLFCYLVPFHLAFNPEYIKFRLQNPGEQEICTYHLNYYIFGCSQNMNDSSNLMIRQSIEINELRKDSERVLMKLSESNDELEREKAFNAKELKDILNDEKLLNLEIDDLKFKIQKLEAEILGVEIINKELRINQTERTKILRKVEGQLHGLQHSRALKLLAFVAPSAKRDVESMLHDFSKPTLFL